MAPLQGAESLSFVRPWAWREPLAYGRLSKSGGRRRNHQAGSGAAL